MAAIYTDEWIRQNIRDALDGDVRVDATNVAVDVCGGNVHLNGTVPTYFQKITAGDDAHRIKGVAKVENDLAVSLTEPCGDQEITETVRGNLIRDVRIANPGNIDVSTRDGVVTLTGTAPNDAQKVDAADDAWTAPGVLAVVNDIAVVPPYVLTDTDLV